MTKNTSEKAARHSVGSWCIWTMSGRRPSFFHATEQSANDEARRLAATKPGNKFLVMQITAQEIVEPPAKAMETGTAKTPKAVECAA